MDWHSIVWACLLAALIGFGLAMWERHESRRLARGRRRRRLPESPAPRAGQIDRRAA